MKILVCGSSGRMGMLVIKCASEYNCEVITTINRDTKLPFEFSQIPDICIDFSAPEALLNLCNYARENNIPILSGTTGLNEKQYDYLKEFSKTIPILHASNFSIGIFFLKKLVKIATESLPKDFDIEIIERHHSKKKDAPSGTAMSLLETVKSVKLCNALFGRCGTGERIEGDICLHSVRGGDIVGEHEVMFAGNGERLELIHRATNREIFARGALYAAKYFINIHKPGLYELSDIL